MRIIIIGGEIMKNSRSTNKSSKASRSNKASKNASKCNKNSRSEKTAR